MKKEIIATIVIFSFIGLAISPSVYSTPQLEEEYVEVQTEFCGLNREPITVRLTQAEAEELEQLIQSIEQWLSQVETREETIVIFNEAINEFHRYGLLGDVGVRQVKRIIERGARFQRLKPIFPGIEENYLCLTWVHSDRARDWNLFLLLAALLHQGGGEGNVYNFSQLKPVKILNLVDPIGVKSLFTFGLLGRWQNEEIAAGLWGFTGLEIVLSVDENDAGKSDSIYIGFTLAAVRIDN